MPAPDALAWTVVMDRVGGYASYKLLEQDGRDYEDVLITMLGDEEAQRTAKLLSDIEAEKRSGIG